MEKKHQNQQQQTKKKCEICWPEQKKITKFYGCFIENCPTSNQDTFETS